MGISYYTDIANQTLIFIMLTVSLNLLFGTAGQISVAQAGFAAIGAYTAGYLAMVTGIPILASLLIGVVAAAIFGAVVSFPALRLAEEYVMLLTLAIQTAIIALATALPQFGGVNGLFGLPTWKVFGISFSDPNTALPFIFVMTVAVYLICRRFTNSPYGLVLRGIRDDELVTKSLGKRVLSYKVQMFTLSAAIAGLAGGVLAFYDSVVSPSQYGFDQSVELFAMVVIGGLGNPMGAVVGAIVISISGPILERVVNLGAAQASLVQLTVYGVGLVIVTIFLPRGILPEGTRVWSKRRPAAAVAAGAAAEVGEGAKAELAARPVAGDGSLAHLSPEQGFRLTAVNLRKAFSGVLAVDDASVELLPGKITALVGPNGAGKTTLFNILAGAIRPDAGQISLNGREITGKGPSQIARLGLVRSFQDVRIYPRLSVLENVAIGVRDQPGERIGPLWFKPRVAGAGETEAADRARELLGFVGLTTVAANRAGDLGFGQQKLLAVARLLATDAPVLLLDEPASGVDQSWVHHILALVEDVRDRGRTICIVEHNLQIVRRLADRAYFMDLGRIVAEGSVDDLVDNLEVVRAYFGTSEQRGGEQVIALEAVDVAAGYGKRDVLFGVDVKVETGEIVLLVGHNGAGKTTFLRCVAGLLSLNRGCIRRDGEDVTKTTTAARVRAGMWLIPSEKFVFAPLSVEEALQFCASRGGGTRSERSQRIAEVFALFPVLAERRSQLSGTLSGGQQRMLSLGMALTAEPRLLLLDEPSLGLAPGLVVEIMDTVRSLAETRGLTVVLVEQNITQALRVADRAYVMRSGAVVREEPAANLLDQADVWELL